MSVSMETDTDLEILLTEAPDEAVPCEISPKSGCQDPASWWLVNNCCGAKWGVCNAHKVLYISEEKKALSLLPPILRGLPMFKCSRCGLPYTPDGTGYHWEAITR